MEQKGGEDLTFFPKNPSNAEISISYTRRAVQDKEGFGLRPFVWNMV
jgi:hypothetical protein